jgi:hypothetical protein
MTIPTASYRVYRRQWPMVPALLLGLVQIAAGVDTLVTHFVLPPSRSPVTTVAAILFILLGLAITLYVGATLIARQPLIEADTEGLALYVAGAGQPPMRVPWDSLKAVEIGKAGAMEGRKDDPVCLILRYTGTRVHRPAKLMGVHHSTKGSLYIRGSYLPPLDPIVESLLALMRAHQ